MPIRSLRTFYALLVIMSLVWPGAPRAAESIVRQTFLLICDTYRMRADDKGRGGMEKIAAALKAERARDPNVFIAHAGDALSPSLLSGFDRGQHMVRLLSMVGLDVFVPGNHEFDFGPDVFRQRMAEARFPVHAANLSGPDGKPLPGIGATTMIERDGVKIGVAGFAADVSPVTSSPGNLRFEDTVRSATRVTAELRKQGADIVVIVVHEAFPIDEALRRESGADVVLSGHDHVLFVGYDGKTAFAEAMQDGLYVVAVDLEIRIDVQPCCRQVSWWPNFRLLDTAGFAADLEVAKQVAAFESTLSTELDVPVGRTLTGLDSRNAAVRGGEAAIGDLFADAVREELGAEAAILNGGGIRGNRVYAAGTTLTRRDIVTELPFSNLALLLDISGADLKTALEQGLALAENLTGRFPQVSGMRVRADLTRPTGERVVSIEVGGSVLDPARRYRFATNDFMARGGDGYDALTRAKVLIGPTDAKLVSNLVMTWIAARGSIAPALDGRIVVARDRPPG